MALKYKVGDRVRIKNFDWFRNEGAHNMVVAYMKKYYGEVVTIKSVHKDFYRIKEDDWQYCWTDEMIEGLVEEECNCVTVDGIPNTIPIQYQTSSACFHNGFCGYSDSEGNETSEWNLPEGYQFVDENGNVINATKIVLEKKEKEYPKTYEECCKIMGVNHTNDLDICEHCDYKTEITYYEDSLLEKIEALYRLIICRDAYWKIAGEEMGLGKPWEPDWTDDNAKYSIYTFKGALTKAISCYDGAILSFPTEEMRDAFCENFKELIDQCKELL